MRIQVVQIVCSDFGKSRLAVRVDGENLQTFEGDNVTTGQWVFDRLGDGSQRCSDCETFFGEIHDLFVFNRGLSMFEENKIGLYLGQKHNITTDYEIGSSLPDLGDAIASFWFDASLGVDTDRFLAAPQMIVHSWQSRQMPRVLLAKPRQRRRAVTLNALLRREAAINNQKVTFFVCFVAGLIFCCIVEKFD